MRRHLQHGRDEGNIVADRAWLSCILSELVNSHKNYVDKGKNAKRDRNAIAHVGLAMNNEAVGQLVCE